MSATIFEAEGFRGTHSMSATRFYAGHQIGGALQLTIGQEYCSIDKCQAVELAEKLLKAFK